MLARFSLPAVPLEPADDPPKPEWFLGEMVGRSAAMQQLFARIRWTVPHLRCAVIEGEPGAGKRLTARTLHLMAEDAGNFLATSVPQFLLDGQSTLDEAQNGTLYLDRLEDCSTEQQQHLAGVLRYLEHARSRTGAGSPARILVGSRQPLRRLAAAARLQPELLHRLTAIRFTLPPLRDRTEDIPLLAGLLLQRFTRTCAKTVRGLAPGTLQRLVAHSWPGNLRELESVLAAAALECDGEWIRPIDLPPLSASLAHASLAPSNGISVSDEDPDLDRAILRHVTRVLAQVNGNKLRAAQLLGISRSTLYRLLEPVPIETPTH